MSLFGTAFAWFYPRRSIGPFSAYLTIKEISTDRLSITQHPVLTGASITDHSYSEPSTVMADIIFDEFLQPLSRTYGKILDLQKSRIPFSIRTGKRTIPNMLIADLTQVSDAQNENVLRVQLIMQQVLVSSSYISGSVSNPDASVAEGVQDFTNQGQRQPVTPSAVDDVKNSIRNAMR